MSLYWRKLALPTQGSLVILRAETRFDRNIYSVTTAIMVN